jgi:putative hemolysin
MEQQFIQEGIRCNRMHIPVQQKYKMQSGQVDPNAPSKQFDVPPLLKAYFKAGARICSEPAIDRKFKCADFLVVLDTEQIEQSYRERYVPA